VLRDHDRIVRVDMRDRALRDLRPGDRVVLGGRWDNGQFDAYRIERIR